jgi:cytochrome P450
MMGAGGNMLWRLIVRNSQAKCLQKNVFFKVSELNPVICYDVSYFPGPKSSVLNWIVPNFYGSQLHRYWHDAEKFGPAVYYKKKNGDQVLLLSTVDNVKVVFESEAFLRRPENHHLSFAHSVVADSANGLFDREFGTIWTELRASVVKMSAFRPGDALLIEQKAAVLADRLSTSGKVDPFDLVQAFTVDLYGEIAFGSQFDSSVGSAFKYWFNHDDSSGSGKKKLAEVRDFLDRFVAGDSDSSWFALLLNENKSQKRNILKAAIFDVFALSLNNAFAVNYGFFLLAVRPELQEKLFAEIQAVDGQLTIASLHCMRLLMKVVKEINRAYPAAGAILSRQSFDKTEIDGKVCFFFVELIFANLFC